jgi:hypothetical protein
MTDQNIELDRAHRKLCRLLEDARGFSALLGLVLEEVQKREADDETRRSLGISDSLPYRAFLLDDDNVDALRQAIFAIRRSIDEAWPPFVAIYPSAQ